MAGMLKEIVVSKPVDPVQYMVDYMVGRYKLNPIDP
jgi:hypothetical protein